MGYRRNGGATHPAAIFMACTSNTMKHTHKAFLMF